MEKNIVKINENSLRNIVAESVKKVLKEYHDEQFDEEEYNFSEEITTQIMALIDLQGDADNGDWRDGDDKEYDDIQDELKENIKWISNGSYNIDINKCFEDAVNSLISSYNIKIKKAAPKIKNMLNNFGYKI